MITESHMHMLQSELRELRQRMSAGKADLEYLTGLHSMTQRMLDAGRGSMYEKALGEVHKLMTVIVHGEQRRGENGDAAAEIAAIQDYFKL